MRRREQWHVEILPSARRELLALRTTVQSRLRNAIKTLAADPAPADSIAMRGKGIGLHRLRVGGYRVVYRIQDKRLCVLVIRVANRSEVYSGWEDM